MTPPKECPHPKILDPVTGLLGLSKETLQVWWIYDLRGKKSSELSRDAQSERRCGIKNRRGCIVIADLKKKEDYKAKNESIL